MSSTAFRKEIRFTGFGGQGIVVMGYILGKAAAVFDGKEATMTQSYGPEARGGASSTRVIISNEKIYYPYVTQSDFLVCMSQEGYEKYRSSIKENSLLIIDEDLVTLQPKERTTRIYKIPATRFAEDLGRKIVANIVMLGFFSAFADFISEEALRKAIATSVPKPTVDLNLKAFDKGRNYAAEIKHIVADIGG